MILFALGAVYLASVVMHCEYHQGTLSAGYPSRMFTLPVRTSVLVAWPMLYGTVALTLLWLAMVVLIWMPAGIEPAWWVVPLLVVALAWLQAIFWAVPGSPLAKILVACAILPALKMMLEFVATAVALFVDPQSRLDRTAFIENRWLIITIFFIGFLPLAYVVAVRGVACDRRGTRPNWEWARRLLERAANWLPQRRNPIVSTARAQFWIEWRCQGRVLPLFPVCFLVFIALVVAPFTGTRQLLQLLLVLGGAVPIVAFFVGHGMGKSGFWSADLRLSTWQATLPLSSEALAIAKLHMAAASALLTWVLLFFAIPLWLVLPRRWPWRQIAIGDHPATAPRHAMKMPTMTLLRLLAGSCMSLVFVNFCFALELLSMFEARTYTDQDGGKLLYRLLKPKDYDSSREYPLVLFFHGAGERGDDNAAQLKWGMAEFASEENREKYPCCVVAPQCPNEEQWVDTPWTAERHTMPEKPTAALRRSIELVGQLEKEFSIDGSRLYITGLSMGGYGVWDAIQRHPDLFAAAAPVCGGGDPRFAPQLAHLPIWAFHGAKDPVVKPQRSREMIEALKAAGGRPQYTEYPDAEHNSWSPTYANADLFAWLFSQKKSTAGR